MGPLFLLPWEFEFAPKPYMLVRARVVTISLNPPVPQRVLPVVSGKSQRQR